MNPTLELLGAHRTIRRFAPGPLDDETVRRAVGAAQRAATSSNIQAYSLLRVRAPGTRARLVELTGGQPQVVEAGAFFVVSADQRRHALAARRAGRSYEPNLETFLLGVVDASLFAQNLVVAFESLDLGICYIGGLRNSLPEVDELLELPEHVLPLFGLCVGVPAEDPSSRPRLPLEAILFDERYPGDGEMERWIGEHDRAMGAWYAQRAKPGHDWSGGVTRKFAERRREHLAAYYRSKGARLD